MGNQLGLSSNLTLEAPATNTLMNGPVSLVANWQGTARNVEVALSQYNASGANETPPKQETLYCGYQQSTLGQTLEPKDAGFFLIEYGVGSHTRRRYVDMLAARLYLGFCDSVRVSAKRWRYNYFIGSYVNNAVQVSAAIGEASGGSYDELTSTQVGYAAPLASMARTFKPPEGAYALEWGVGPFTVTSSARWWGSAEPKLTLNSSTDPVDSDPATGLVPSYRRLNIQETCYVTSNGVAMVNGALTTVRWFLNS